MSLKFSKNRSVSIAYCKVPIYYTGLINTNNKNKELVLMDRLGDMYTACWRNHKLCTLGIEFLVKAVPAGFIFKNKEYSLGNRVL